MMYLLSMKAVQQGERQMADKKIQLDIVTPYGIFFQGEVGQLVLPAADGEIGILAGHTPMIVALQPGQIRLSTASGELSLYAGNGYAEIGARLIILVVSAAEWDHEIDLARAEAALARAGERLVETKISAREKAQAERARQRARARLKVKHKQLSQQ